MGVSKNDEPIDGYLKKLKKLANDNKIILIFDECTSNFKKKFGGLHKKYGVKPEIESFGKSLGNGYAISACIGKKQFMEFTQQTFISSTFWTEPVGPTATLQKLEIIVRNKLWETISELGRYIKVLNPIFAKIKKCEKKIDINTFLEGLVCHNRFKCLN